MTGVMDNVNVIRAGFFAPDFSLPDSNGDLLALKGNLKDNFICLCFFPDGDNDKINGYLKDLNVGLPPTSSGLPVKVIGICPEKSKRLKTLKEKLKLNFALLFDSRLMAAKKYYVVNNSAVKPSVHFSVFVIDDGGTIRYRASEVVGFSKYVPEDLRSEISRLI